jgi:hypothetical protein
MYPMDASRVSTDAVSMPRKLRAAACAAAIASGVACAAGGTLLAASATVLVD